eukprot:scaffold10687_cov53-Phaeocystis_antarctica.AAC.3
MFQDGASGCCRRPPVLRALELDCRPHTALEAVRLCSLTSCTSLDEGADHAAYELGARLRRGVLGAEPLRDGRALVGEPIQRADGIGHDLGGDRAHVVVGHLRRLARPRRPGRSAAAALAVHLSLQRISLRRRCRGRRGRCHGLHTRPGRRRRPSHYPPRRRRRHLPRPLRRRQPRRPCRRLLLRLALGLLLRLQQPAAPGPRVCAHAALPHLAWSRRECHLERSQHTACDGRPQRRLRPLYSRCGGLGRGGGRQGGRSWLRRFARLVACGDGAACLLLLLGLLRAGLPLGLLCLLLGQQLLHRRIRPRRLRRLHRLHVLPDELRDSRLAVEFGPLQGGLTVLVEQLGVGLGAQQGLHARLFPSGSGHHQGGGVVDVLQVRVSRVLQQEEQDGGVAVARSTHECGVSEAAWQVNARALIQQLPHDLQVAVGCGGMQQGGR